MNNLWEGRHVCTDTVRDSGDDGTRDGGVDDCGYVESSEGIFPYVSMIHALSIKRFG